MTRIFFAMLIVVVLGGCVILPGDADDWDHGERYEHHRYEHHYGHHDDDAPAWGGRR